MSNTGETNMGKISKNSLMYWLHKMYTTKEYIDLNYKAPVGFHNEEHDFWDHKWVDSPKPVDGCSWYRKGFLLLLLTTLLVAGGLVVSAISIYLAVNFLAFLLGGWVVFSWVNLGAVVLTLLIGTVSTAFYFIYLLIETIEGIRPLFPEYMSKYFPKKDENVEREKYWRKKAKQPSAIAQYYKAIKEKYCPVLTLEKEDE
jgi:hypothetical protein